MDGSGFRKTWKTGFQTLNGWIGDDTNEMKLNAKRFNFVEIKINNVNCEKPCTMEKI